MSHPPPGIGSRALSNLQTGSTVKAFGLQLPKSKQAAAVPLKKPVAFSMDDDDDDAPSSRLPHPVQLASIRAKRYADEAARVLAEDATAFSYDDVYEQEVQSKKAPVVTSTVARLGLGSSAAAGSSSVAGHSTAAAPARYIDSLLSKAAARKLEQEAVYERNLLKDREKDDVEHSGKDRFLTSSYKAHLAEQARVRKEQEEQDRRDEEQERRKAKGGGMMGSAMALAASRNVLEGLAGTKRGAPDATTTATAKAEEAKMPRQREDESKMQDVAPTSVHPLPSSLAAPSASPANAPSHADEPSAKRPRTDPHQETSSSDHPSTAAPATQPAAPSLSHVDAVAVVAAQLTSARNPLSKAEEARARLAARKAAAAGGAK
jgi:hypothetical protein